MAAQGVGERTAALSGSPADGDRAMPASGELRRERRIAAAGPPAQRMPQGVRQTFEREQTLAEGSQGEKRLYAVRQGILVSSLSLNGEDALVSALHFPGDLVPVAWSASERPVTLKAVTDAEVEVFAEDALRRFFQQDAEGGFLFFERICDLLVSQRETNCILRRLSVEGRLASFLLTLGGHLGVREGRRFRIALPMRRCEIANYLGLRSETLSRVFARWRAGGLIEPGELRQITFPDIGRLEAASRDET